MRRSARLFAPLGVVLVLGLSACGSTTKAAAPATTTPTTARGGAAGARQAYTTCLESHGIPASAATARPRAGSPGGTPSSLPAGVTASQLSAARQACRSQLPRGGGGGFGGGFGNSPQAAAYRNCLSLHGVTLPKQRGATSTTSPSSTSASSVPFDPNSPTVKAAMQACAALRPQVGPPTTTTST